MTSPTTSSSKAITWRFRLTACCLVLVALAFSQRPGRIVSDTKFDLVADPGAMLGRALHMWDPSGGFGQVQNQAYGYLFPMGPFFWLGDVLTLPGWVVQRMWWSLLLVVAFLGVVKLCAALDLGSPTSRIVAGFAYALSPRILTTIGPISIEAWPMALAPWVLVPLVLGSRVGSPRRAAALSALAVAAVGGVNAAATFAVIPLGAVWLLTRSRGPRRRALMAWWPALVVAGTAWWLVPLLLLGAYSPPFLDFIETASITTFPTTLFDVLRGTSHWVPYVDSTWRAGNDLLSTGYVALNSAVLVVLGLVGIALRGNPHRQFLALGLMLGLVLVSLGHSGSVSGWFAASERSALDGVLAPLRNVHKFEPLIRLPLVLGLAHVLAAAGARVRSASRGRSLRERLEDGDRVAYVGVLVLSAVAVAGVASPALAGRLAPADDLESVPGYWEQAVSWIGTTADRDPDGTTALLVPGSSFATYLWGTPEDEPAQAYGAAGWAVRNAVPLAPPGNIRMLDAIESRLAAGRPSPGLAAYLRRAGVSRLVVRNDLRPSGDVPVPVLVHQAIEGSPGLTKVAEFGPDVGGPVRLDEEEAVEDEEADGDDEAEGDEERSRRVVVDGGWHAEYPAIEVYEVSDAGAASGSVAPPVVVGGPEDILELLDAGLMGDEPALLALDAPDGPDGGGLLLTDGLRRREATFARVHDGRSATLDTADDGRRDVPAREYVLGDQARWETTAQVLGARSVDASGSRAFADTIGPVLPETLPYAAFDGRPETAWESGIPRRDEDPWVRVVLDEPREVGPVTVVAGENQGDDATSVVVETEAGTSAARAVLPGESVTLVPPPGPTAWIRVGAAPTDGPAEGLSIAEVRVQGLDLDRTLVLPEVPAAWGAPDHVLLSAPTSQGACVEVGSDVRCGPGRQRADEDGGVIDRTVRLGAGADYDVSTEVRPVAGDALEGLLQRNQLINVDSSSTGAPDARASAVAAIDGATGTTWIADVDDPMPTLTLNWIGERPVRAVRLGLDRQAAAAPATRVELVHDDGRQTVRLDADGYARVQPFSTTRLEVRVLESARAGSRSSFGGIDPVGVGVSELRVSGVDLLPVELPETPVDIGCGFGPALRVGDQLYSTSVTASARQLFDGELVPARVCGPSTLGLAASSTRVVITPAPAFRPERVVLSRPGAAVPGTDPTTVTLRPGTPVSAELVVEGTGSPSVAALRQNVNAGWHARSPDGVEATAVTVDGWQQGWRVPAGVGSLDLRYGPDRTYRAALLGGAVLLLVLLLGAVAPRRGEPVAPPLYTAVAPWVVPVSGLLTLGLVAGWPGVCWGGLGAAVASVARTRFPAAVVALAAGVPLLAAAGVYWLRPLGSEDGWAGALLAPQLLVIVSLGAWLGAAHGGRRLRSRWEGRSTAR
jgi:arabinofuranan 3-O-arabinosyltransferase